MPIYEYHCGSCSQDFEYLVLGGQEPEQCPACGAKAVCRLMSTCGFVSRGAGGETVSSSAGAACSGCSASSCTGCGH